MLFMTGVCACVWVWSCSALQRLFCHQIPSCPICLYPPRAGELASHFNTKNTLFICCVYTMYVASYQKPLFLLSQDISLWPCILLVVCAALSLTGKCKPDCIGYAVLTWYFSCVPIRETRSGGNVPSATSLYIKVISRGTDNWGYMY